ncbi:MAG TPA: hypothetical protein DDZ88_25045, partial [Verrucomicrobiales bacterium]|nr:hypothetical protein [Verrucomicrobiales bacterium]
MAIIAVLFPQNTLRAFFGVDPAVPGLLNYQGRVTVSGASFTGTGQFKFALVNKTGTVTYWSNDNTSTAGSQPTTSEPVQVANGIYSVQIGNSQPPHLSPNMTPLPASVFENNDVHLRIWFSDGVNGFQLITPDQRIASVGYALMAAEVTNGAITSGKLAPGAVTGDKLAAGAVQAANIAAGAVGGAQLAAGAVQGTHIADGAVGNAQIANHAVGAAQLRLGLETGTIANGAISAGGSPSTLTYTATFSHPFTRPPTVNMISGEWVLGEVASTGFTATGVRFRAPLDFNGDVGEYSSLAVIDGNPAIAYYDDTNDDLKYIRATSVNGTTWGSPMTVVSTGVAGRYNTLIEVNGRPAVAYGSNTSLFYVRASDATGMAWGAPRNLASSDPGLNGPFTHFNMAMVAGRPAVSFRDLSNSGLHYMRAFDVNGTSPWERAVLIPMIGQAEYNSLVEVDGRPAIGYYNTLDSSLYYIRAGNADGTVWGEPVLVDSTANVGQFVSMAVVDGFPAMSYHDATNGDLKYVRAADMTGTAAPWSEPVVLDSNGNVGQHASLRMIAGRPAVAYYDVTNGDLKYVAAADSTGAAWYPPIALDSNSDVGVTASLAEVSGGPAVAYHDTFDGNLKFTPVFGLPWRAWDGTVIPIVASNVADGAVGSAQIATGAVTSSQLAAGAVQTSNIGEGAITTAQLAAGAVQSSNIASGAITTTQLAAGAVQSSNIAAGAITSTQLAKPPQSGTKATTSMQFDFGLGDTSVIFPNPFSVSPRVTLTARMPFGDSAPPPVWIRTASTTTFTARVDHGRPQAVRVKDGVFSDRISATVVEGNPALAYVLPNLDGVFYLKSTDGGKSWPGVIQNPINLRSTTPFASDMVATSLSIGSRLGPFPGGVMTSYAAAGISNTRARSYVYHTETISGDGSQGSSPRMIYESPVNTKIDACAVVVVNEQPTVVFHEKSFTPGPFTGNQTDKIHIIRGDALGSSWGADPGGGGTGTIATIDNGPAASLYSSTPPLSVVALPIGMPAVLYYDKAAGHFNYCRVTSLQSGAFGTAFPVDIGSGQPVGSMAMINGTPAVAFIDDSSSVIIYRRAIENTGTLWGGPVQILSGGEGPIYSVSLAQIDSKPAVLYEQNGVLRYRRATDSTGSEWGPSVVLDTGINQVGKRVGSPSLLP